MWNLEAREGSLGLTPHMSFGQERCDSELENAIFQTPRQDYTLTVPSVDEVYFSTRELRPLARQLVAAV